MQATEIEEKEQLKVLHVRVFAHKCLIAQAEIAHLRQENRELREDLTVRDLRDMSTSSQSKRQSVDAPTTTSNVSNVGNGYVFVIWRKSNHYLISSMPRPAAAVAPMPASSQARRSITEAQSMEVDRGESSRLFSTPSFYINSWRRHIIDA